MNLKNIFFSYSRVDASDFALKLAVDLQKAGFNVWIDQEDIRAGSEWDLEIEKALETCDCLLFIESEKSVTSNNVLDEVYFALEQHKVVIPVIYKDSKTPYRLSRLQHIDFTISYETGLTNLINEMKRPAATGYSESVSEPEIKNPAKSSFKKSTGLMLIVLAVVIAAVAVIYLSNKKEDGKPASMVASLADSVAVSSQPDNRDPVTNSEKVSVASEEVTEKKLPANNDDKTNKIRITRPVDKADRRVDEPAKIANLPEAFIGKWDLAAVEPKPKSFNGYLNIEETENSKVKILSNFQFYFFKTNDTAFFSVFNGFASCASCILKNEMQIIDNDVAFGTQTFKKLEKTQEGIGNAGDVLIDAGDNTSIRASVRLQLVNKNTAVIKVQKQVPTPISRGFVVPPFVYTFRFTKREY
jgi:hypothetical protein